MAFAAVSLLYQIVGIAVSAIVLWLVSSYAYKNKNKKFTTALLIALITGVVSYVIALIGESSILNSINLAVTIILGFILVKEWYNLKYWKAIMVWLTWFLIMLVISYILNLITPISFSTGLLR